MEIISVTPRGYCQGVVRAIQIARKTTEEYPDTPITMLGMIVHNEFVVNACRKMGIRFVENAEKTRLELLDEVKEGVVIFTAHGISDEVRKKAEAKGLITVDASCPDVMKTHALVKQHTAKGYDVLYIGKKNHPESEGTVSLSNGVHLITKPEDLETLPPLNHPLITNQTTISLLDAEKIMKACMEKYPDAVIAEEICNATRMRQEAVMRLENIDLLIVVGDRRSNNSRQLKEIGTKTGIPETLLIDSVLDLKEEEIRDKKRIAVTAGSSTPNNITKQVIDFLKEYAETGIWNPPASVNSELF